MSETTPTAIVSEFVYMGVDPSGIIAFYIYDFIVFIAADYMCLGPIGRWIVPIIHSLMI